MRRTIGFAVLAGILITAAAACDTKQSGAAPDGTASNKNEEKSQMVEEGKKVSLEYTLKLADGTEVASNVGDEPLVYTQGQGEILPALEKELATMHVGETKQVTLEAKDAYGEVDPEAFREVETDAIPENARHVGALLSTRDAAGNERTVRVHEVRDDAIVIDFNHPLAGQKLSFDLKVVAVEP